MDGVTILRQFVDVTRWQVCAVVCGVIAIMLLVIIVLNTLI